MAFTLSPPEIITEGGARRLLEMYKKCKTSPKMEFLMPEYYDEDGNPTEKKGKAYAYYQISSGGMLSWNFQDNRRGDNFGGGSGVITEIESMTIQDGQVVIKGKTAAALDERVPFEFKLDIIKNGAQNPIGPNERVCEPHSVKNTGKPLSKCPQCGAECAPKYQWINCRGKLISNYEHPACPVASKDCGAPCTYCWQDWERPGIKKVVTQSTLEAWA